MDRLSVRHAHVLAGAPVVNKSDSTIEPIGPPGEWFLYAAALVLAIAASAVWPLWVMP